MHGIARTLPALKRAQKLQKRAARAGFDWPVLDPVFAKIHEELEELKQALKDREQHRRIKEEMGDVLFTCVNLARHLNVDAEDALRASNNKFERRFECMERELEAQGKDIRGRKQQELEELWQRCKRSIG